MMLVNSTLKRPYTIVRVLLIKANNASEMVVLEAVDYVHAILQE